MFKLAVLLFIVSFFMYKCGSYNKKFSILAFVLFVLGICLTVLGVVFTFVDLDSFMQTILYSLLGENMWADFLLEFLLP